MIRTIPWIGCMAIALFAVQAPAAIFLEFTPNPIPAPGLASFLVSVVGDGENVSTIAELNVTGDVHQIWAAGADRSAIPEDLSTVLWPPQWDLFDTHILVPEDAMLIRLGNLSEKNDGSNPVNLDLEGPFGDQTKPSIGLGGLTINSDGAFTLRPEFVLPRLELLQLVILEGGIAHVELKAFGSITRDGTALQIWTPEPTAGLLLGLGLLAMPRHLGRG